MVRPAEALQELATALRDERSVVSPHVRDPGGAHPVLGLLAAAGPRAAAAPGEYALVVEAVREGYLLHYGDPRLVAGADPDLALLAGDYLYALGLERLARLGDLEAVRELSDLISLAAQVHEEAGVGDGRRAAGTLWLAVAAAIGSGSTPGYEEAKAALRTGPAGAPALLLAAAREIAAAAGTSELLDAAAFGIHFTADLPT